MCHAENVGEAQALVQAEMVLSYLPRNVGQQLPCPWGAHQGSTCQAALLTCLAPPLHPHTEGMPLMGGTSPRFQFICFCSQWQHHREGLRGSPYYG